MREWIPVSTSPKGRLVVAAVKEFGARPFDEVTVGELSSAADVTTGALYHHFGSKQGLYSFVRDDVEQRLLDRMEGALEAAPDPGPGVRAALLVGFDFAVREHFTNLLGARVVGAEPDRLADLLAARVAPAPDVLGTVLAAAWRSALMAVAQGAAAEDARAAIDALDFRRPG